MSEQEFLKAYESYADALFRHCYFKTGDREIAKDLVQDTFMRTWDYVVSQKVIENPRALLYRVANNAIIDWRRKKKSTSLDMLQDEGFDVATDEHVRIEDIADGKEAIRALTLLPDQYREVITMRYVDDLGPKEIAEILGETENVVSVRLHRGLEKLKEVFGANK